MTVARCPDCDHPEFFHVNSICSNAGCYCRREFIKAEPDASSPRNEAPGSDKEGR